MPPIRGVILETFGAGNAPQRQDLMQALQEACQRGVVVVAISQCSKGSVSDAYETGRTLLQMGVIPGHDMTPEVHTSRLLPSLNTDYHPSSSALLRSSAICCPNPNSLSKTFAISWEHLCAAS